MKDGARGFQRFDRALFIVASTMSDRGGSLHSSHVAAAAGFQWSRSMDSEFGVVCKLNHQKLFGFIRTNQGDVFFHRTGLLNRPFQQLATGYEVSFRRSVDKLTGKQIALDVRVLEP